MGRTMTGGAGRRETPVGWPISDQRRLAFFRISVDRATGPTSTNRSILDPWHARGECAMLAIMGCIPPARWVHEDRPRRQRAEPLPSFFYRAARCAAAGPYIRRDGTSKASRPVIRTDPSNGLTHAGRASRRAGRRCPSTCRPPRPAPAPLRAHNAGRRSPPVPGAPSCGSG